MSEILDPVELRDFSRGRIAKSAVAPGLAPLNSVAQCLNVDFSEVIGSAKVRKGNSSQASPVRTVQNGPGNVQASDLDYNIYDVNLYAQTFTPTDSTHGFVYGVTLRLRKVGTPVNPLRVAIYDANGTDPTNLRAYVDIDPTTLTSAAGGALYTIAFAPVFITPGGVNGAIVLSSTGSPDAANCVEWFGNAAGGYSGGSARVSTDNGNTWGATGAGEDFYFRIHERNLNTTYSETPLGLYTGQIAGADVGVAAFVSKATNTGVIYFRDSGGSWLASNLQDLSTTAKVRFAIFGGRIFMANGAQNMASSSDNGRTWVRTSAGGNITTNSVIPSLLWVSKNRLLASGYTGFRSRVYFSSIIDPNASPSITWDTDPTSGDWIDINPDDGGQVTGFSDTSNLVIVFKNRAMYRLNTINKTVDSENIFNIGAVTQEAIVKCLGLTYFYSGDGVYRTDGGFPEMISRIGVQDFLDHITGGTGVVYLGNDYLNVYVSIGDITMPLDSGRTRAYNNTVLKFSPRDENWMVFTYSEQMGQYAILGISPNESFFNAQYNGDIGIINYEGTADADNGDYGAAIPYELETQELEIGDRSHLKVISDHIVLYTKDGGEGSCQVKPNDDDWVPIQLDLSDRVNIGEGINVTGNFFTLKWMGEAKSMRPTFQGFKIPSITDQGLTK